MRSVLISLPAPTIPSSSVAAVPPPDVFAGDVLLWSLAHGNRGQALAQAKCLSADAIALLGFCPEERRVTQKRYRPASRKIGSSAASGLINRVP